MAHKNTIANSEVTHEESLTLGVKLDLEVSASVLLSSLIILRRNHKIIHLMFLNLVKKVKALTIVVYSISKLV